MTEVERCRMCGWQPDAGQLSALSGVRERRANGATSWLCVECARQHLRDIESKLPDEWW
jgi:hypothetical protein